MRKLKPAESQQVLAKIIAKRSQGPPSELFSPFDIIFQYISQILARQWKFFSA